MLYLVIFLIIAILLAVLCFVSATVTFEYILKGLDDYIIIRVSVFNGIIKFARKLGEDNNKPDKKLESELDSFLDKLENAKKVYGTIESMRLYFAKRLRLKNLSIDIEIGTGDAAYTGLLTGMGWAAAGTVISFVTNIFKTENVRVNIKPDFAKKKLKVELLGIFNIKLVYIIVVGIKYYFTKIKSKKLINNNSESGGLSV